MCTLMGVCRRHFKGVVKEGARRFGRVADWNSRHDDRRNSGTVLDLVWLTVQPLSQSLQYVSGADGVEAAPTLLVCVIMVIPAAAVWPRSDSPGSSSEQRESAMARRIQSNKSAFTLSDDLVNLSALRHSRRSPGLYEAPDTARMEHLDLRFSLYPNNPSAGRSRNAIACPEPYSGIRIIER